MAAMIYLRKRMTHKYRDGWSGLDQWNHVGTVKELAARRLEEPRDFDDGGVVGITVRAPAALARTDLRDALASYYSGSSCQHEHDCCGCAFYRASVRRTGRRDYFIRVSIGYNY